MPMLEICMLLQYDELCKQLLQSGTPLSTPTQTSQFETRMGFSSSSYGLPQYLSRVRSCDEEVLQATTFRDGQKKHFYIQKENCLSIIIVYWISIAEEQVFTKFEILWSLVDRLGLNN